ncbi:membrane-associated oxidoreductase [Streptomyces iconiensis]|uniref:Membrane-associated oxidoreductase n=1 Tax=Streptomyces iconiensis TaxID=1384038 RepID=A0ABT7A6K3_9ACTN|nr:membrane-associated oxidoreductase [Streptomyces iconiensis]MDJ1136965.1 membrane-associated oxidoreductase [Streptomyces iconiensis]
MVITDLTSDEQRVHDAFADGTPVDLEGGSVRATVLRAMLLAEAPRAGTVPGLWLSRARVTGCLDLAHGTVAHPVRLLDCEFTERPHLYGAGVRQLDLSGSRLPGLLAAHLHVEGVLRLSRCHLTGPLRLSSARLAGSLFLDGVRGARVRLDGAEVHDALILEDARLASPEPDEAQPDEPPDEVQRGELRRGGSGAGSGSGAGAAAGTGEPVLSAVNTRIGGGVNAVRLTAHGGVLLTGARVEGTLNLEHAHLVPGPGGEALVAPVLTVSLDLLCNGLRAEGEVRLSRSRVGGRLNLEDAHLSGPGHTALRLSGMTVGAGVWAPGLRSEGRLTLRDAQVTGPCVLTGSRLSGTGRPALVADGAVLGELRLRNAEFVSGGISLRGATCTTLHLAADAWPDEVRLDGFTYQALSPHLPPAVRLGLLAREATGHVPYAYEQLTAAYRRAGDETAARTVQLAKHRHHRSTLPRHARLWGVLQDATVGYGYRPLRAAGWLLALLATGTVVYALHHPAPLKPPEAPVFNPLFYTLDLLLPVVGFGQESAFRPAGPLQWLAHTLTVLGWVLATTVLTGATRTLARP